MKEPQTRPNFENIKSFKGYYPNIRLATGDFQDAELSLSYQNILATLQRRLAILSSYKNYLHDLKPAPKKQIQFDYFAESVGLEPENLLASINTFHKRMAEAFNRDNRMKINELITVYDLISLSENSNGIRIDDYISAKINQIYSGEYAIYRPIFIRYMATVTSTQGVRTVQMKIILDQTGRYVSRLDKAFFDQNLLPETISCMECDNIFLNRFPQLTKGYHYNESILAGERRPRTTCDWTFLPYSSYSLCMLSREAE